MPLETNFNIDPFYDDFDETKNFARIMFRPGTVVQARELTQLQTILQNQIERFGDNIFAEGTIIKGCNFIFDDEYFYVKLPDIRIDGQSTNPDQYVGYRVVAPSSNLQAIVLNSNTGLETSDPDLNTIFVKYINAGTGDEKQFSASDTLNFYANTDPANTTSIVSAYSVLVANSTFNPTGEGYAFSVTEGVIFQKGFFVRVANNISVIVDKYSASPNNISVGFTTEETIVDELTDSSLYDNASGYTNYNAPGAERLRLTPTLVVANTDALPSNNFFSLVEWQNGNPVRLKQQTAYSTLGREMARRTHEESGNYVVRPFNITTEHGNTTHFNIVTSSGLGYIEGYRVENSDSLRIPVRRGTDTKSFTGQHISTNYGNFVFVNEYLGNFSFNVGETVSLRDTAATNITDETRDVATAPGSEIGTARILSVVYDRGVPGTPNGTYRVYVTDIKMNSGKPFSLVRSLYSNSSTKGVADIVLEANNAVLKNTSASSLVIPVAKQAVANLSNINYVYRTNTLGNSYKIEYNTGAMASIVLSAGSIFPYGAGILSAVQERNIIVIPTNTANVSSPVTSGTVSANLNIVSGTGTAFLNEYEVDDYIAVNGQTRRISSISNNTYLTLSSNLTSNVIAGNTMVKTYPAYVPIPIGDRNDKITLANASSLAIQLVSKSGANENLSSNLNVILYYDILKNNTSAQSKLVNKNKYVKIDTTFQKYGNGTITANTTSPNVTGVSTTFDVDILPNYRLYDVANVFIGTVQSVTNSTQIILSSNGAVSRAANVYNFSANGAVGPTGPWCLGLPDVYKIDNVYRSSGNTFNEGSTYDITNYFELDTGQKDGLYDMSYLRLSTDALNSIQNGDKLLVKIDLFKQSSGTGFFNINSYPIDDANTANTSAITTNNIPRYTTASGGVIDLRDAFDFRPQVSNTANVAATAGAATINPANTSAFSGGELYIASPDQSFEYDLTQYVGRIDKLIINSFGEFLDIEGLASENPRSPADIKNSMTLSVVKIPPYPSLTMTENQSLKRNDYAVTTTTHQTRRYTMRDIGSIDSRVKTVEYYTSLNLLEQQSKDLVIPSDITGNDRFKNGMFVDGFNDQLGAQTNDPEFKIGYDMSDSSIIPSFIQTSVDLKYVSGGLKTGDLITLPGTEEVFTEQLKESGSRTCSEVVWNFKNGRIVTFPEQDSLPDTRLPPVSANNAPTPELPGDVRVVPVIPANTGNVSSPTPPATPVQPPQWNISCLDISLFWKVLDGSPYVDLSTLVFNAREQLDYNTRKFYYSYSTASADSSITLPAGYTAPALGAPELWYGYPFNYPHAPKDFFTDTIFTRWTAFRNATLSQFQQAQGAGLTNLSFLEYEMSRVVQGIRWSGKISVPSTGSWTFYGSYVDGMVLYINGNLVINDWNQNTFTTTSGAIALTAGEYYDFELILSTHSFVDSACMLEVSCASPSFTRQLVPWSWFSLPSLAAPLPPLSQTPNILSPGSALIQSTTTVTPGPSTTEVISTVVDQINRNDLSSLYSRNSGS